MSPVGPKANVGSATLTIIVANKIQTAAQRRHDMNVALCEKQVSSRRIDVIAQICILSIYRSWPEGRVAERIASEDGLT